MIPSSQRALRIAPPASAGPLSRARKQFNNLVKKLEAERAKLGLWREELPKIHALADNEYHPLTETFDARRKQLLALFDCAYSHKSMGKKDRQKLQSLICSTAWDLMQAGDDDLVKEIYNKHSGRDFDQEMDEERAFMLGIVGSMTGLELDADTDIRSPDAFFASLGEKFAERARNEAQAQAQATQAGPAKPSARAAKHQAEEAKLKQSVRDIFRKLASALHPDRESDCAERERKTALMQRANVAYAANDLLALLELQLEVEQIDQTGLDNLDDERIKQYNRILDRQVKEIQGELFHLEAALAQDIGWESNRRPAPDKVLKLLRADISLMRAHIEAIEAELNAFTDIVVLKLWLKDHRIVKQASCDDGPWF
ncbi:MAG TPA: hypothetical protein VF800_05330 [Telluria sp.]|jgi:hypothetical protein